MDRYRELATWGIRPAVELHKIRRGVKEVAGFVVLVAGVIALLIGGFLL